MNPVAHVASLLERTVAGPMWHGPAVAELLADVTADQARRHPIPGAHSIWELVLHLTAWAEIARERLTGRSLEFPPPEVDWPPAPSPAAPVDQSAWQTAVARLTAAHRALAADVRALTPDVLVREVPDQHHTTATMLHGVVEHGAYHGGQIALLVRALGVPPAPGDYDAPIPPTGGAGGGVP
jgi:uncharacterized damage-inducible protein DinB